MIDELTSAQLSTLREMASYRTPYWFRQATCRTLVAKGLAEPLGQRLKRPAHRATEAGRALLSALKANEARDGR